MKFGIACATLRRYGEFLNIYTKRFFYEHMLAGFNRLSRGGDMELISDPDNHRFNFRIG